MRDMIGAMWDAIGSHNKSDYVLHATDYARPPVGPCRTSQVSCSLASETSVHGTAWWKHVYLTRAPIPYSGFQTTSNPAAGALQRRSH